MNIKDIKDGWINHMLTNVLKLKSPSPELQEHIDRRYDKCAACPHLKEKSYFNSKLKWHMCGKCGCAFPAMIFAYEKRCPDGQWDAVPKQVRKNAK
jgi:hypothetical protein